MSYPIVEELPPENVLFGASAAMQQLRCKLSRVCTASVPILLQGEIGVGKGSLSRFIHQRWFAGQGHYARLSCASVDKLWGPFAFCAVLNCSVPLNGCSGHFERLATLFLDEINELPVKLQQLLANLLVEHSEDRNRHSDRGPMCIVSSSTRDLRREIKEGHFRRDLLQQLAVVTIDVPPLRDRTEDLPQICEYLRRRCCRASGVPDRPFPPDLFERMLHHRWPGNFSELESFISRFVALGPKHCAALEDRKPDVSGDPGMWLM